MANNLDEFIDNIDSILNQDNVVSVPVPEPVSIIDLNKEKQRTEFEDWLTKHIDQDNVDDENKTTSKITNKEKYDDILRYLTNEQRDKANANTKHYITSGNI